MRGNQTERLLRHQVKRDRTAAKGVHDYDVVGLVMSDEKLPAVHWMDCAFPWLQAKVFLRNPDDYWINFNGLHRPSLASESLNNRSST